MSCCPTVPSSGPSTRVTCATSIWASCGCSLLTDCAAHSDEHSRSQPQEQVIRQRLTVNLAASAIESSRQCFTATLYPALSAGVKCLRIDTLGVADYRSANLPPRSSTTWLLGKRQPKYQHASTKAAATRNQTAMRRTTAFTGGRWLSARQDGQCDRTVSRPSPALGGPALWSPYQSAGAWGLGIDLPKPHTPRGG
jgi:hypothetical protein